MSGSITDPRVRNDPRLRELLEICQELGPVFTRKLARVMQLLPRVDSENKRESLELGSIDEQIAFLEARAKTH